MKTTPDSGIDHLLAAQDHLMKARTAEMNESNRSAIHAVMQFIPEIIRMKEALSLVRKPESNTEGLRCDAGNTPNHEEVVKV